MSTINKAELLNALEIVKPGLSSKEVIEQSTAFAFIEGNVVTYNDEISVKHPVLGLEEITGAVQAEELYSLLKKLKKDEIEITVNESEIRLSAGKSKAGLILHQEIKLPLDEIGEIGKWKTLPDNFLKGIQFAIPSCSRETSKPILTCVHCNQNGFVEASDGHRISRLTLSGKLPVKTFLLPADSANKVLNLNPVKIAEGNGWIHFKTEAGTVLSCRIFEDAFPDVEPHARITGTELTLPKTIAEILDRAAIFAKRDNVWDETVTLSLDKGKLLIRSESEAGWFEEKLKVEFDNTLSFMITPSLFKNIIRETQTFIYSEKALRFDGEDWFYVMALKY